MYLDDSTVSLRGEEEAKRASGQVWDTLQKSGFVVKSVWTPSHSFNMVGF